MAAAEAQPGHEHGLKTCQDDSEVPLLSSALAEVNMHSAPSPWLLEWTNTLLTTAHSSHGDAFRTHWELTLTPTQPPGRCQLLPVAVQASI